MTYDTMSLAVHISKTYFYIPILRNSKKMHDDINSILINLVNNIQTDNDNLDNYVEEIQTALLGGIENKGVLKKNNDYDILILNELKNFI